MSRLIHLLILIGPPILIPLFASDETSIIRFFLAHIAVIVPLSTIWRMKSLKYSSVDIFKTFIPFLGMQKRLEIFRKK